VSDAPLGCRTNSLERPGRGERPDRGTEALFDPRPIPTFIAPHDHAVFLTPTLFDVYPQKS
jgi:hypothetical protein